MSDVSEAKPSEGTTMLAVAMVAAVLLSVGGIAYAVTYGVAVDGGRGGAIAVALTFFILFVGRGTAEAALEAELPKTGDPSEDAALELAKIRNSVAAMLDWSRKEKLYLTISSVVGTLTWGFGDLIAIQLGAPVS